MGYRWRIERGIENEESAGVFARIGSGCILGEFLRGMDRFQDTELGTGALEGLKR